MTLPSVNKLRLMSLASACWSFDSAARAPSDPARSTSVSHALVLVTLWPLQLPLLPAPAKKAPAAKLPLLRRPPVALPQRLLVMSGLAVVLPVCRADVLPVLLCFGELSTCRRQMVWLRLLWSFIAVLATCGHTAAWHVVMV
jgi:hypothetical protein